MAAVLGIAIHQHPPLWEFAVQHIPRLSESERYKRYLEHLLDCIAIADGRMTAEEANAKWFAILKKEREEEARQMSLGVDRE